MQQSLLDRLVELMERDYREDWESLCHHAQADFPDLSPEEAARRCLRAHNRSYFRICDVRSAETDSLCWKYIQLFVDAFRNQMIGRIKGTLEKKLLDPALITMWTLRFDPDELVLDGGKLIIVDVRVEPADRFSSAAILKPDMRSEPEQPTTPAPLPHAAAALVRKLSGKEWVSSNLKSELLALTITEAANVLAKQSETAANCIKPLQPRYVEKVLRDLGHWPKAPGGSPKQRPSK
jgi:hypothetical protein